MPLPPVLNGRLSLPVMAAPMFIVSTPELVIQQCCAGIVGSFPALNARPQAQLTDWLQRIGQTLEHARQEDPLKRIAPYAVNLIVHPSNSRLAADLDTCGQHRVPIIITSLQAPDAVVEAVHAYGGLVFHDVTTVRHAARAMAAGVDGLILVAAGAGGHAGRLSPFALLAEVRQLWDGPIALAGAISQGRHILAAQAMGADLAYIGTPFVASPEANATEAYREAIVEAHADDIVYTPYFTGVAGNYLKASIRAAGLDPDALPAGAAPMNIDEGGAKAWRDIWGAGQGVGSIDAVLPVATRIARWREEYRAARLQLDV